MRKILPILLFCCLFALISIQSFANEWVDMGPLNGSAVGHVWSRIVDEIGNTQGRNEVWQLSLPCPVIAEIVVKCPDPYLLEVSLDYTHAYHGVIQHKPERTATGFYTKEFTFKEPELIKNLRISVYNRKPSTDQRYQLTVNMKTLDGKPATPVASSASAPGLVDVSGTWIEVVNDPDVSGSQVVFSQSGNQIQANGSFIYRNVTCVWNGTGTVEGRVAKHSVNYTSRYPDPAWAGADGGFSLNLSPDGKTLSGTWYNNNGSSGSKTFMRKK